MSSDNETKIEVPLRLLKNLIDCIDAQKTLSSSNIDIVTRNQIQKLIDNTKEWANSILVSKNLPSNMNTQTDLQETLDFVKTDKKTNISVGTCDTENESSCVMIVEPDDSEGGFL